MQFGQGLSLQLSPQTHENQSRLPEMTKIALESPLSRGNCELKSWPNCMNQRWILLYFLTPFKWCIWICYKKSPSMLVFCIIYCRDHVHNVSLFGKFLPSNSKPNKPRTSLNSKVWRSLCGRSMQRSSSPVALPNSGDASTRSQEGEQNV